MRRIKVEVPAVTEGRPGWRRWLQAVVPEWRTNRAYQGDDLSPGSVVLLPPGALLLVVDEFGPLGPVWAELQMVAPDGRLQVVSDDEGPVQSGRRDLVDIRQRVIGALQDAGYPGVDRRVSVAKGWWERIGPDASPADWWARVEATGESDPVAACRRYVHALGEQGWVLRRLGHALPLHAVSLHQIPLPTNLPHRLASHVQADVIRHRVMRELGHEADQTYDYGSTEWEGIPLDECLQWIDAGWLRADPVHMARTVGLTPSDALALVTAAVGGDPRRAAERISDISFGASPVPW